MYPDLIDRLHSALQACGRGVNRDQLVPLSDKGLAHDHVRLAGTGLLARMPKQSQLGLSAQDNLDHQQACFERAAASGHTPALHGILPPSQHLPRGALLVEEIEGRPARLPHDLPAIARALGALHTLPLPQASGRRPLQNTPDPLQALIGEIDAQAAHLQAARLPGEVEASIQREQQRLQRQAAGPDRPARCLIAFDAHPGNFIVRPDGRAVLVDLEKCRYAFAGLDLAHATLYTSTTWDVDANAVLTGQEVLAFHEDWARAAGPFAAGARAWHGPLRRAMWLWSITWCAKWRALSSASAQVGADGEDWSGERSDATLVDHVRDRVDHYLSADVVGTVLEDFDRFEHGLRA